MDRVVNSKELYMYINYYILTNDIKCISIDLWGTLISDNMLELNKMKTNILKCKINDIDKRIHFDIRLAKCKNICKCMERDGIVCSGLDKITYFFAGMLEEKYCGEILHRIELIEMSFPIVVNVELLQWLLYWTPLYNFLKNKITHKTLSHV